MSGFDLFLLFMLGIGWKLILVWIGLVIFGMFYAAMQSSN